MPQILKNAAKFLEILPSEHYKFYTTLVAFDSVVDSCFGLELVPGYEKCLKDFESAWMELGLNVTPKCHLLFAHALEDIQKHGLYNEAAAESIHADFDIFYKRYKVKDLDSSVYVDKLQAAVAAYNAGHV